jgi:hypothetical protein
MPQRSKLLITNDVPTTGGIEAGVIFFRTSPNPITMQNIAQVVAYASVDKNSAASMQSLVHFVILPLLKSPNASCLVLTDERISRVDERLKSLIQEADEGLKTVCLRGTASTIKRLGATVAGLTLP